MSSDTDTSVRTSTIELKTHEIPTKTVTPTSGPSWYLKWISSAFLIVGLFLTANNLYPWNLAFHGVGLFGWFIVSILWNDRALLIVNAVGLTLLLNGLLSHYLKEYVGG